MAAYELPVNYERLHWMERRKVRDQYIQQQDDKCQHCGADLAGQPPERILSKRINWRLFPKNFRKYPVHLHHSHETGMTIGAVHNYCNAVLWQYHG